MKQECPCHITLSANRKKDRLIVIKSHKVHSHETSGDLYKCYPVNRRLTEDEQDTAEMLLNLNVPARKINEVLRSYSGKEVTNRDIFNVKARLKQSGRDKKNELLEAIENIIADEGQVRFSLDTDGEMKVLYFQTSDMIRNFGKFPEVIFLDGTYRTNDKNMVLFSILVEDGCGEGRVAAYGLLADETRESISTFLNFFKACNPDVKNTKVVIIDKDFSELSALEESLEHVTVFLCHFHVLKTFKLKVAALPYPEDKKNKLRQILQRMTYSLSKDKYDQLYQQLTQMACDNFRSYFDSNWHCNVEKWVQYHRNSKFTLGNRTNSRIESHHQKVKQILSHRKNIYECVKEVISLECSRAHSKAIKNKMEPLYVRYRQNDHSEDVASMLSSCTSYAADIMAKELACCK